MSLKFTFCVLGIYLCFLTWGVLQERVSTTPYGKPPQKFKYFILLNCIQAALSAVVSAIYLAVARLLKSNPPTDNTAKKVKSKETKSDKQVQKPRSQNGTIFLRYLQCAFFSAIASPFGYASLKHISYPTMTLGMLFKVYKLIGIDQGL